MIARAMVCTLAGVVLSATLYGCGEETDKVMPDVVNKRLDVAMSDLERAGIDDEPEVVGGGTFGVVDESNWTVCEQNPAPGGVVSGTPRVVVERSCESDAQADDDQTDADEVETEPTDPTEPAQAAKPPKNKPTSAPARDTFVMPPLVGWNLQDAQDKLQSLGSYLLTQTDGTGLGRFQVDDSNWKVCGQRPAAGVATDLSVLVELIAVKLDESC